MKENVRTFIAYIEVSLKYTGLDIFLLLKPSIYDNMLLDFFGKILKKVRKEEMQVGNELLEKEKLEFLDHRMKMRAFKNPTLVLHGIFNFSCKFSCRRQITSPLPAV